MGEKEREHCVALYDVAKVINASLEPVEVLQEIVHCVIKTMPVKKAVSFRRILR